MNTTFLTIRLGAAEVELMARLGAATGLTKTEIIKRALAHLANAAPEAGGGLFDLGASRFGRHGDAGRQSADIKRLVRERVHAKRSG